MTYLLGKADVEDFNAWKIVFNGFDSFRTDNGQQGYQVFQNVDNRNEAIVLFEWVDDEDSRAFFASEEMRERLEEAGVKGRPELTELEFVDQKSAQHPSA